MKHSRQPHVRPEVVILFLIVMGIAGLYTLCGCTQGGIYGLYEGLSNITSDTEIQPDLGVMATGTDSEDDTDSFKSKKHKSPPKVSSPTTKSSVGFFDKIKQFVLNLFKGKSISGFDNMGSQFRNFSFNSTDSSAVDESIPDFFKGISFSSKCCPSRYSNDSGCACLDDAQYNIIRSRGGNNIPISQW